MVNTATPGLVGYALADRADAVQLWEPAYTVLQGRETQTSARIDLNIAPSWRGFAGGTDSIPYLGVAAQQEWIDKHPELIAPLYRSL